MSEKCRYEYLAPWPGSHYRQSFYRMRKIRAETLYPILNSLPKPPTRQPLAFPP
jgi:hypothetical protein